MDNFVHADMHPGNILVRTQTKSSKKGIVKSRPHVVFLDVGMIAELSGTDRVNLLDFFKAVALRDGRTAAECTLRLSKNQKCPNPNAFIEVLYVAPSFEWSIFPIVVFLYVAIYFFWSLVYLPYHVHVEL